MGQLEAQISQLEAQMSRLGSNEPTRLKWAIKAQMNQPEAQMNQP